MTTIPEKHPPLQQLSKEVRSHQDNVQSLESTLRYQNNIIKGDKIPNRQSPKRLVTFSSADTLHNDFEKEYKKLYMDYLKKVITHNTIAMELQKGKIASIIMQAERYISNLEEPSENIARLYEEFLHNNDISNPDTIPELQRKLPSNFNPLSPPPKKKKKLAHKHTSEESHFLFTGHKPHHIQT